MSDREKPQAPDDRAPLSGLRVLDLSRVLAGPWCTQLLADLGAEVIKIERPGGGDDTRSWGPPFAGPPADGLSAYFLCANRNKRSVAVNFKHPRGAELLRRLAGCCDVLIENFRPGALAASGLDYESLHTEFPRLVYCSISGFGQGGPDSQRGGYDLLIQAMGGLMSLTGKTDGEPMKVGVALTDILTGLYASTGILAALRQRDASGEGQHIDLALFDVQVAALANQALNYLVSGRVPKRIGNAHPNIVPYQAFAARDGHLIIAVGNDSQFRRFCETAGLPELVGDSRYATNAAHVSNRKELLARIEPVIASRRRDEWIAALEEADVPCGSVNDLAEVFAAPQLEARGMRFTFEAGDTSLPQIASPLHLSAAPQVRGSAPPRLGADTCAVLAELLGLEDGELETLHAAGAIQS
ncbi:MAG TPA: CaiB/BaiF CoA-transferase family protein [Gammaproteobacteria bacterium]|nr:CaiB/BaiF CoA-transferase family protein [Gammaproteobacteria bacterium]